MLMRVVAWVAVVGLALWGLENQWGRYTGQPGGPSWDLRVPNAVVIASFGIAIATAVSLAIAKPGRLRILLAIALAVMAGPLWLSTRNVYLLFHTGELVERGLFVDRKISDVDPEETCFVARGDIVVAVDRRGRELGSFYLGVFPWTLRDSDYFDMHSYSCR